MADQPHNPGLSDKAWEQLHMLLAKLNLKYGAKLQAELDEAAKSKAG
jgi:hypothetical protein